MFRDHQNNLADFYPNYTSTVNGQTVNGAVIIPGQIDLLPGESRFRGNGLTQLRSLPPLNWAFRRVCAFPQRTDFAPRIGVAYRIGGSNKTVIRGGYGRFIETLLTSQVVDGWAVEASDVAYFHQFPGRQRRRLSTKLPILSLRT